MKIVSVGIQVLRLNQYARRANALASQATTTEKAWSELCNQPCDVLIVKSFTRRHKGANPSVDSTLELLNQLREENRLPRHLIIVCDLNAPEANDLVEFQNTQCQVHVLASEYVELYPNYLLETAMRFLQTL